MAIDPKRVQAVFLAAAEVTDHGERSALLDRECAGDAELRRRVEVLLHSHDSAGDLPAGADSHGTGAFVSQPTTTDDSSCEIGSIFAGRYKIREKLGEGGMGVVYVADQLEPVQRRVALKIIKSSADSQRLLARFEQERQALALMDHPNIAKVFDAGIAGVASGEWRVAREEPLSAFSLATRHSPLATPYFVMELIKGVPLTKYCDEAKLTPRQRLELFIPVCQAVQHAHQKGIIHRDLKPSNILIGLYDGQPVPKVIDFGVAKTTGTKLTEQSIYTEVGTLVGTLEYMAPEQAELNNLDIDTRADIYALGVILYELLTGTVPFSRLELKAAGLAEMLRILKEVEPPKPSTRLSGSGSLPSVAAVRQMEPKQLTRLMRGELDWIVMKALEKDRSRRYETANGFARDLERYLADEPVVAGPPSAGYRLRKFVKRNKPQVLAGVLVLLTLVGGVVGTGWGMLRAKQSQRDAEVARDAEVLEHQDAVAQRNKALAAEQLAIERLAQVVAEKQRTEEQKQRAEENTQKAMEEKQIAAAVRDFLQNKLLGQADNKTQADALLRAGGFAAAAVRNPTIRELLDRAAQELMPEKIEANFPKQPLLQAEILETVGRTYRGVGEYGLAVAFLQRAAALCRQHLPEDHPDTLSTLNLLGTAYLLGGKLPQAIHLLEPVRDAREKKLGPKHPDTLDTLVSLAVAYRGAGRLPEAIRLFEQVRDGCEKELGPHHADTLNTIDSLAVLYQDIGRLPEAIRLLEEVCDGKKKKLGPDHPDTLRTFNNLAVAYDAAGRLPEAIRLLEQVRDTCEKKLGPDHPETLATVHNLAGVYLVARKVPEAIRLFEQVRDAKQKRLGPDHPDTLKTLDSLAAAYRESGELPKAILLLEQVRNASEKQLGPDHPDTLSTISNLAASYWWARQLDKAIPLFEDVVKRQEAKLGRTHPSTLLTIANLGVNYRDAGRLAEAIPLLEEAYQKGKPHALLAWVPNALLTAYIEAGKTVEATTLLREQLVTARQAFKPENPQLASVLASSGSQFLEMKQYAAAEPILRECLTLREKLLEQKQVPLWQVANAKSMLGAALLGQRKFADAEPLLLAGYEGLKKDEKAMPPQAKNNVPEAVQRLVDLYEATGKKAEAARWKAKFTKEALAPKSTK